MEIIGIGTDLVENARLAASIEKFGDRFLQRVFCGREIIYCKGMRNPAPCYAARFAVKEAVSKAFGCGIGELLGWLDIEVAKAESGAPSVILSGGGAVLAKERGVGNVFVSISHTESYAVAYVVLVAA